MITQKNKNKKDIPICITEHLKKTYNTKLLAK